MIDRRSRVRGLAAVVLAVSLFALSLSVIKWPGIPGSVIAFWRLIGAALMWWALLGVQRVTSGRSLPSRQDWKAVAPGALAFGLNISFAFLALTRTSVVHADIIGAMSPLILIPLGALVFGERPYWRALGWGGVGLVGLYVVVTHGPARGVATPGGDLLAVIGMLAFCAYQVNSKIARRRGVDLSSFMAITMVVALVTATPVAVITGGSSLWPLSWQAWTAVGLLSVFTGMVGHGLLYLAQRSVPLGTIAVIQTSQPAQSALWAWILLGEAMSFIQVQGLIIVLVAMSLVVWQTSKAPLAKLEGTPASAEL